MQTSLIVRMLVLLSVANGAPVLARDLLRNRFAPPVDGGAKFSDGRPLLGTSKTFRGIALAVAATSLCAPLLGWGWGIGFRIGLAAMVGDLASSFIKRPPDIPLGGAP